MLSFCRLIDTSPKPI